MIEADYPYKSFTPHGKYIDGHQTLDAACAKAHCWLVVNILTGERWEFRPPPPKVNEWVKL